MNRLVRQITPLSGQLQRRTGSHVYISVPAAARHLQPRELPHSVVDHDLQSAYAEIRQLLRLHTRPGVMTALTTYYFNSSSNTLVPTVMLLMAHSLHPKRGLTNQERRVTVIWEMLLVATLLHDDAIDNAGTRRGMPSVNTVWSSKQVVMAGACLTVMANMLSGQLRLNSVTVSLSRVVTDLVEGELVQIGWSDDMSDEFQKYLRKSYLKTASLIAYGLKAYTDAAYQFGSNLGMAVQIIDDLMDFVTTAHDLGKPVGMDLKEGVATAPVFFAVEEFPELRPLILRRFRKLGDVEVARKMVLESQGPEKAYELATRYCKKAKNVLDVFPNSEYKDGLIDLTDRVLIGIKNH